jgi:trimethylamine:corrinoid methyltransferase-like protein
MPSLLVREPHATWVSQGSNNVMERARERVREILDHHRPLEIDPQVEQELDAYRKKVAGRELEEFYLAEQEENQDFDNL